MRGIHLTFIRLSMANPRRSIESITQFLVLSGPCTSTGSCATSPNYPHNYGNSESCEILAPGMPLYFTQFATEAGKDILTFGGQAYSGSFGPPQGTTTSDVILWSSDNADSSTGWRMCTVHGVNSGSVSNKYFHVVLFFLSRVCAYSYSMCLLSFPLPIAHKLLISWRRCCDG